MKTPLQHLALTGLAIAALTWSSLKLNATEVEDERETKENIDAREAYRRLQLQDENGQIPPDAWTNAYAEKEAMPFLPEAWSEFSTAEQVETGMLGGVWSSIDSWTTNTDSLANLAVTCMVMPECLTQLRLPGRR